jgi:Subtilase family
MLPFVDYVEPARDPGDADPRVSRSAVQPRFNSESLACDPPTAYTQSWAGTTVYGDSLSYSLGRAYNRVVDAWTRTQGDNVRIAFIDTGVDVATTELRDPNRFSPRPLEYTRTLYIEDVIGGTGADRCGHGTRMIGVAAAPNDGYGVTGMAWKSDIISVRAGNTPTTFDAENVYNAIWRAMGNGRPAHIVNFGFSTVSTSYYSISDIVRFFYYAQGGPVFTAAIGTDPLLGGFPNALHPSDIDEVIAVVAVDLNGNRDWASHYGPKAEISGYISQATVAVPSHSSAAIPRIMGSSGAAASVAGIAALIRARYPQMSNRDIRARLRNSTSHVGWHTWQDGYGTLNAYRAVGGFEGIDLYAPDTVRPYTTFGADAHAHGDGPFSVRWVNGQTGTWYPQFTAGAHGQDYLVEVVATDLIQNLTIRTSKLVYVRDPNLPPPDCGRLACPYNRAPSNPRSRNPPPQSGRSRPGSLSPGQ